MINPRDLVLVVGCVVWLCCFSLRPVSCAGGRLTIGGPTATLTGRNNIPNGNTKQPIGVYNRLEQPLNAKTQATDSSNSQKQDQDFVQVHEFGSNAKAISWTGAKSAVDLAPESEVVGVHFGQLPASNDLKLIEADKLKTQTVALTVPVDPTTTSSSSSSSSSNNNKTKQSQEFDTHLVTQQVAVSSSSSQRPVDDEPNVAISTAPTTPQQTAQTQTSAQPTVSNSTQTTTNTPPGWPVLTDQPSSTPSTTTSTTSETAVSSGPVGARIDREGDAVLCGEANANGKSNKRLISDRIVGGHKTEPGEFPFQVRLNIRSRRGSGICGGVVLDRWHVLTAAHCMTACVSHQLTTATIETSGVRVTVGDHSIKSDDGEQELDVETILPHEKYDACNFYANDHDIALIKTVAPIPFKFTTDGYGSVNRPCMPTGNDVQYKDGEPVIVSGWGVTRENSGALSNILRYVQVPVVNTTRCQETYGSRVTQDHVCAGFQAGGKDSCQGDSGGPLVRVVDNRYELVGIVSFGYGCGQAGAAGVYTKVASYLDWIKTNTNKMT